MISATAFFVIPVAADPDYDYTVGVFAIAVAAGAVLGCIWGAAFGLVAAGVSRLLRSFVRPLWIRVTAMVGVLAGITAATYVLSFSRLQLWEALLLLVGVVASVALSEMATRRAGWGVRDDPR